MNNYISLEKAKNIMGENFIGPDDLKSISKLRLKIGVIPDILYSQLELESKKDDYLLILGIDYFDNGAPVTIQNLLKIFGKNPDTGEPCFYNQDWYDSEEFIRTRMENKWFLIKKNVYEDSRAVQPTELMKTYLFPSAITCSYTFFVTWFCRGIKLWYHEFVWCSDTDHNGDRIYVGKYHDVDGVNKNGFSIHRHLALRTCYGCIDQIME